MRNLLIFFTFTIVGVCWVTGDVLSYNPKTLACARKYNFSEDFFKSDFTTANFTEELEKYANETTRKCFTGCYIKTELDYVLMPEYTIEDLRNLTKKANMSESYVEELRKCNAGDPAHNDCEFVSCYFAATFGLIIRGFLEEGVKGWASSFKHNGT